jgi:fido (protein-threonine AMPylation protein)
MPGHHTNCSNWDYETHPQTRLVTERCNTLIGILQARPTVFDGYDTRRVHRYMFRGMCPGSCSYLAGNFRGSDFPCLRAYPVGVRSDWRVGSKPGDVAVEMQIFTSQLEHSVNGLAQDFVNAGGATLVLLKKLVALLAKYLVYFFTIHPYANGNGHTGRFIVWVLLARFGMTPKSWPLDSSPDYGKAIMDHRDGKPQALEDFVMQRILA